MSALLVMGLAFLVNFILSYKLLRKVVKNILNSKLSKSKFSCEETEKFRKDVLEYYEKSFEKYKKLDAEVEKVMNEALGKADSIIKHSRQQLDQTLDENARFNSKRVTEQVEKAIVDLQINTVSIAADAIRRIIHECKDDRRNSDIIFSYSRDLSKKLH